VGAITPPEGKETPSGATDGMALVQSHRRALTALCRKFRVRTLNVFGSVLRPDFDFKSALESLFGRSVDVVELTAMPDSRLKRAIERSQVAVYEQAA